MTDLNIRDITYCKNVGAKRADILRHELHAETAMDLIRHYPFRYTDRSRTLGYWVVNGLYAQSNAEKAGLRKGDHITAVNGRSVKDISFEERRTIFDGLTGVTLTIQRGDTTQEIRFEFDEPKI